ncbi:hypothetical protein FA457_20480 [Pseudomonas aeruginosa]|nr:hypothetical protein [Pseudomonas aeruginosa]
MDVSLQGLWRRPLASASSRHAVAARVRNGHCPATGEGKRIPFPIPVADSFHALSRSLMNSVFEAVPEEAKGGQGTCMPGREGLPFPPGDQVAVIGRLFVVQQARQEPIYRDAEQRLARRSLDRN